MSGDGEDGSIQVKRNEEDDESERKQLPEYDSCGITSGSSHDERLKSIHVNPDFV